MTTLPNPMGEQVGRHGVGEAVADAALDYTGVAFMHHQRAANCTGNEVYDRCMEVGIDSRGFDCTGLAIRAISDATGLDIGLFRDYRHLRQLVARSERLDERQYPEPGDLVVFRNEQPGLPNIPKHIAVSLGGVKIVHANSISWDVKGPVELRRRPTEIVSLQGLIAKVKQPYRSWD